MPESQSQVPFGCYVRDLLVKYEFNVIRKVSDFLFVVDLTLLEM